MQVFFLLDKYQQVLYENLQYFTRLLLVINDKYQQVLYEYPIQS